MSIKDYKMDFSKHRKDFLYGVCFFWKKYPQDTPIVRAICCQCVKEAQSKITIVKISQTGARQCDMCGAVNRNYAH